MTAIQKNLSVARVEWVELQLNKDEVISKLKTIESDVVESLKVMLGQSTERSSLMSKQFEAEVDQGPEKVSLISGMRQSRFMID